MVLLARSLSLSFNLPNMDELFIINLNLTKVVEAISNLFNSKLGKNKSINTLQVINLMKTMDLVKMLKL
jgi:hypothetical protein